MTFVTTHFKKSTTGNAFSVSLIVYKVLSHSHPAVFFHRMVNVSTLLLDDTFKLATPLTNDVINETLRPLAFTK